MSRDALVGWKRHTQTLVLRCILETRPSFFDESLYLFFHLESVMVNR